MRHVRFLLTFVVFILLSGSALAEESQFGSIPVYNDVMYSWPNENTLASASSSTLWRVSRKEEGEVLAVQQAIEDLEVIAAAESVELRETNFFRSSQESLTLARDLTAQQVDALEAAGYTVSQYVLAEPEPLAKQYRWIADTEKLVGARGATLIAKSYKGDFLNAEATYPEVAKSLFVEAGYENKFVAYYVTQDAPPGSLPANNPLPQIFPATQISSSSVITDEVVMRKVAVDSLTDEQRIRYGLPVSGTVETARTLPLSPGRSFTVFDEPAIQQGYSPDMMLHALNEFPIVTASDGVGYNIPSEGLPTHIIIDWMGTKQMQQKLPGSIQPGDLNVYLGFQCTRDYDQPHGVQMLDTAMNHLGDQDGAFGFNGIQSNPRAWVYPAGGCTDGSFEYNAEVSYNLIYEAFERGDLRKAVVTNAYGYVINLVWPQNLINAIYRLQRSPFDVEVFAGSGNDPGILTARAPAIMTDNCIAGLNPVGFADTNLTGCKDAQGRAVAFVDIHGVSQWNSVTNRFIPVTIYGTSISVTIAGTVAIWNHGYVIQSNSNSSLVASWQRFRNGLEPVDGSGVIDRFWGFRGDPRAIRGYAAEYGSVQVRIHFGDRKFIPGIRVVDQYRLYAVTANYDNTIAKADMNPIRLVNNKIDFIWYQPGDNFMWEGKYALSLTDNNLPIEIQLRFIGYYSSVYLPYLANAR